MKRLAFLLILLVSFASIEAQKSVFKPELYVGAGGGPLISRVDFVPRVGQTMHRGIHAGVAVKYISEKHLGLMMEANLTQRGWTENYEDNPEYAYTRTLKYLEIPLMTHVYFGNKVRFIFNLGPQLSFLMGSSSDMSQALSDFVAAKPKPDDADAPVPEVRYGDADRTFDYGLIGGAGMELKTGIGDFDLEGRYYFGLGDIFNNTRADFYSRSAHRIVEAKLTYYFKIL